MNTRYYNQNHLVIEKEGKEAGQIIGRSPYLQPVFLNGSSSLLRKIVSVEIKSQRTNSLEGMLVET